MAEDVNWLSTDELTTWRAYLASHGHLMRALDQQLQRDSGIGHADYAILAMLADGAPESTAVTVLADRLDHSQSRTSHAVARLERRGLVARRPDDSDRRIVNVRLTDAGTEVLRSAAPGHVRSVREYLFDAVSPTQAKALQEVCLAMLERLGRPEP